MSNTSVCYEDYTPNLNENVADKEWPVCKKRKIQTKSAGERIIQEDILKEKPILNNGSGCEKSQDEQHNDDQINNKKHYEDALALTTHIQPPNLSDSDSNDSCPITNDKELVYNM